MVVEDVSGGGGDWGGLGGDAKLFFGLYLLLLVLAAHPASLGTNSLLKSSSRSFRSMDEAAPPPLFAPLEAGARPIMTSNKISRATYPEGSDSTIMPPLDGCKTLRRQEEDATALLLFVIFIAVGGGGGRNDASAAVRKSSSGSSDEAKLLTVMGVMICCTLDSLSNFQNSFFPDFCRFLSFFRVVVVYFGSFPKKYSGNVTARRLP